MKTALPSLCLVLALAACASSPEPQEGGPAAESPAAEPAKDEAAPKAPAASDAQDGPDQSRSSLAEPPPPSERPTGPPLPRSMMFKAQKRTDRGLELMELAFKEKRTQRRIELFDLAIDQFEKATKLYYQRLQQPGAQQRVIDNQIARLQKFLDQCYSNRPLADE